VAFPGSATVSESSPDVALTFDPGKKSDPKKPDAAAANEDAEGTVFAEFLKHFEVKIRLLIRENDVLPSLEEMRAALLEELDK
jgi:hypothetical protein